MMGQSGGPEQDCVSGVTSPTAPARMEVVMGKCFPLTGPGHHLNFPSYPAAGTTTSTTKKEVVNQNSSYKPPSHTVPEKSKSVQQNGLIPNTKHTSDTRQNYTSSNSKAEIITEPKTEEPNAASNQPGTKPKHPILRRAQSAVTPEPEVQNSNKSSTDSLLARIKAKVEQIAPSKDDISGKEAWEITQKKKSLMREEFFKIPYEECNKEAAMSLGGRLNKSEPRLNTICKDRKKRNSLSYKRRVHFDLDDDKGLDDDRPSSFTRRHTLHRVSNVGPPKKVVVSIYSIDDPAKRVQQVQLPDNYSQVVQESIVSSTGKPGSCQIQRDKNHNRIKTARPTDLDSLQKETVPDKTTGGSITTETQITSVDTKSPVQHEEKEAKAKSQSLNFTRRSSTSSSVEHVDKTEPQEDSPATDGFQRRYSLPPPVKQMSVRPRQPSAHFPSSTHHTATHTPSQQQHSTNTANSTINTTPNAPIPAPRSHLSTFKKSQSLQDSQDEKTNNTCTPICPRPDTLQLSSSTPQPPSRTNMVSGSVPSSRHTTQQLTPLSSQKVMSYMSSSSSTQTHANTATTPDIDRFTRTPIPSQSSTHTVSSSPREVSSSLVNPPIPKPRKWISVSQQTGTSNQSPCLSDTHTAHPITHISQSNTQTPQCNTHTLHSDTRTLHSNTQTPQSKVHSPQNNTPSPQSDTHTPQSNAQALQANIHTPQSKTHTSSQSNTYISQSNTHTSQSDTHTPKSNTDTPHSNTHAPHSNVPKSPYKVHPTQPTSQGSKTTIHTPKSVSSSAKPATYAPLYQTFSSPHVTHTSPQINNNSQLKPQKPCPQIVQTNGQADPPRMIPTEPQLKSRPPQNNKATHKSFNKENKNEKLASQKTNNCGKGNSINILMTKGDSYSKHSIVLNSHINSKTPSVTVRKIYMPSSAPARCSPSPTPSCASSSCSFGSSGSSSGCFSGSPSPTPTPSPTRIRASGVPTDL